MGACGSRSESKYTADDKNQQHRVLTREEMRNTKARDSMRFNNRHSKGRNNDEDEESPKRFVHQRDSMMFNNRNNANKTRELATVTPEDFIGGCRDVLRSPVMLDKIRDVARDGQVPYEDLDHVCVSMIPRDPMFRFYSLECLRHSYFATCAGPSDISKDVYGTQSVPVEQALLVLRNMIFLKRMMLCFQEDDFQDSGLSKGAFHVACVLPESVYLNGDPNALFDRVAAEKPASNGVDWRHLVVAIADSFINSVALPKIR